jgi:hypothetical protein
MAMGIWMYMLKNTDGAGTFGAEQTISTNVIVAFSVYAIDIDGDNDMDVLSASYRDNKIAWYVPMEQAPLEPSRKFLPLLLEPLLCSQPIWMGMAIWMIKLPGTKMMVQAPLELRYGCIKRFCP